MWNMHSLDPHPGPPENPGLAPNYGVISTPLDIIKAKDTYNNKNKNFHEDANMNRVLTERFLSLFAPEQSPAYYNLIIQAPGRHFGRTFAYFYELFGTRDEREIKLNRNNMAAPWNRQSGFQSLKAQNMNSVAIAAFATAPIKPKDVLNMLVAVNLGTGVFKLEYTGWLNLPNDQRTIINAWD